MPEDGIDANIAKGMTGSIGFNGRVLRANASNNDFLNNFAAGEVTINSGAVSSAATVLNRVS